jgi:YebC/PmpR family DNA-binding regulatory protein
MSGHSKWSKIKRQKAVEDQKRGADFSRLGKAIAVAVRQGGGTDPDTNSALRMAIEQAKAINMPRVNIERAIARGAGGSKSDLEAVVYEGYGPGGVALVIAVKTDNRSRTGAEIRSLLDRSGGSLGAPGCAAYMFDRQTDGSYVAKTSLPVAGDNKEKLAGLLSQLKKQVEVKAVYHNGQL